MSVPLLSGKYQFTNSDDMERAAAVCDGFLARSESYQTINLENTMTLLGRVGPCFQLAYAGTKGFKTHEKVSQLLLSYQTMMYNASSTCQTFVRSCRSALQNHLIAFDLAEKNVNKALTYLTKCEKLAETMETASGAMVNEATQLVKSSEKAFLSAIKDENVTSNEKKKMTELLNKLQERTKQLEEATRLLRVQEQEAREAAQSSLNRARDLEDSAAGYKTVSSITSFFTLGLLNFNNTADQKNEQAKKEREAVEKAEVRKRELQDLQRQKNEEFAGALERLRTSNLEKADFERVFASLEIAVSNLGEIVSTFKATAAFWAQVKSGCKDLRETLERSSTYLDEGLVDKAKNAIQESGVSWLALGIINLNASRTIETLCQSVGAIVSKLPTEKQAAEMILTQPELLQKSYPH